MKTGGYIIVTCIFKKEGNRWTGYCKELGTVSLGRSISEAARNMKEALELNLNTLEDVGERARFFRDNNVSFHKQKPKQINISVPFDRDSFINNCIIPTFS